jgi:hypothetical protein
MTDYTTQAAHDAAPTVAPVEGCYALLRCGWLIDPNGIIEESDLDDTPYYLPANSDEDYYWINGGVCQRDTYPKGVSTVIFEPSLDIIAVYTPAQLLAPRPDHTCPVQLDQDALETALAVAINARPEQDFRGVIRDAIQAYLTSENARTTLKAMEGL